MSGLAENQQKVPRNSIDEADFVSVANKLGYDAEDVRKVVHSFFDSITIEARNLPFDDGRKIYSKEVFDSYRSVYQIPKLGRIGPVYSRYLKWRANESRNQELAHRSNRKGKYLEEDIEKYAADILSGKNPEKPEKKKAKEFYDRIWLIGKDGKKQARQIIKKSSEDV